MHTADRPPSAPWVECTASAAAGTTHVTIRMPDLAAVCGTDSCCCVCCEDNVRPCLFWMRFLCSKLYKTVKRGLRWAMLAVGCFMLLVGVPMLSASVSTPVLYAVLALATLSMMASLFKMCSEVCTDVHPLAEHHSHAINEEFVRRLVQTTVCLAFTAFLVWALVMGIGAEYGYIKPYH